MSAPALPPRVIFGLVAVTLGVVLAGCVAGGATPVVIVITAPPEQAPATSAAVSLTQTAPPTAVPTRTITASLTAAPTAAVVPATTVVPAATVAATAAVTTTVDPKAPDQKGTGRGTTPTAGAAVPPAAVPTTRVPPTAVPPTAVRPTATPTREPTIRNLYSVYEVKHGSAIPPSPLGNKGDDFIYTGEQLPQGCEIISVFGVDYNMLKNAPSRAPAPSVNDALHGWDVTRQATGPRDIGVKVHWFYNTGGNVQMRVYYVVRQPWNVDCAIRGKTQDEP